MRNRARWALAIAPAVALALVAGWCGAAPAAPAPAAQVGLVDVNSAGRAQLKSLPGIGAADVDRIIAGRPYLSKADLATRQVVPAGVYLSLKDRIIARQPVRTNGNRSSQGARARGA